MNTKKSWTILLSSGPQTPIKQFKLAKLSAYIFIAVVCSLILAVGSLAFFINKVSDDKQQLLVLLEEKNAEMEKVKQEYVSLQEEAKTVQETIEEFKLFEQKISNLNLEMPSEVEVKSEGSGGAPYPTQAELLDTTLTLKLAEMKQELPELIIKFEETVQKLEEYEQELRFIPTIIPAEGRLTSGYGNRRDPFNWRMTFHSGLDIAGPINTPILAAAEGTVIHAGTRGTYGLTIIIDHGNTYETLYAHLNRIDVEVGQKLKKGEIIGGMGTTGRSTGVHLHYEIRKNGEFIDPYLYMTFHTK